MRSNEKRSVKKLMADAFVELLSEKDYTDITVTDVVNKAQVARVSFYRNFNSVSDIIDFITDELANEFTEKIFPVLSSNSENVWYTFILSYLNDAMKNKSKFETVNFQNNSVIFSRLNAKMQMRIKTFSHETVKDKYTPYVKASLISNISKKWIDDGAIEKPEEIAQYILSFITLF